MDICLIIYHLIIFIVFFKLFKKKAIIHWKNSEFKQYKINKTLIIDKITKNLKIINE
jgi:hypothetical protein